MENTIKIIVSDEKVKEFIKESIIEMIKKKKGVGLWQLNLNT